MPRRILAPVLALVFALLAIGRVAEATNESTEHGNHSQACSVVWKAGAILDADLTNDDPEHPGLMVNLQGEKVAYSNGGYLAEVSPAFGDPGLFEMNHFYVGSGATLNQVWRMPVASDLPLLGAKVVVTLPEGIVNPTFSASSTNAMMSRWGAPYSDYTWAQRDLAAIDNGDGTWTVNLGDLEAKSGTVFEFSGGLPAGTDVNTRKIASAVMTATYPQGVTASTEVCAPTPTATETVPAPTVTATATQTVPAPTATATATQTLPAPPMMTERPTELPRTGA